MRNSRTLLVTCLLVFMSSAAVRAGTNNHEEPKVKGSIPVQGASQADFPKLARVTPEDATKNAKEKVPGRLLSVGLENEDGFLVYAIHVVDQQSNLHEVIVDAGSGKVLAEMQKNKSSHDVGGDEEGEHEDE